MTHPLLLLYNIPVNCASHGVYLDKNFNIKIRKKTKKEQHRKKIQQLPPQQKIPPTKALLKFISFKVTIKL